MSAVASRKFCETGGRFQRGETRFRQVEFKALATGGRRDVCRRNDVRLSTLEGFANCLWQTGGIQFGSFDQKNQVHQVFDASVFPAHSWQRVAG
jgi:hypothetical protein